MTKDTTGKGLDPTTEALKAGLSLLQLAEVIRNRRFDSIIPEAAATQLENADRLIQRLAVDTAGLPSDNAGLVARELPLDRETLGRMVREAWVRWAETQPAPKPSWLVPYDELAEPDKEADRQIGETIAKWTVIHAEAIAALSRATEAVAEVVWWDPRLDPLKPKAGKIIDASLAWMDEAPLGTKLYATPPAPQPALALIEELTGVLRKYWNGRYFAATTDDDADIIDAALASAKRFKEGD